MASIIYNTYKGKDANDWATGTYRAMLVTNTYVPNPDHDNPDDGPAANEITGGLYARQTLGGKTRVQNNALNSVEHSADNVTFSALILAAPRYAVVYREVTTDADHQLVAAIDLGVGLNITGDLMVRWNGGSASGLIFSGV